MPARRFRSRDAGWRAFETLWNPVVDLLFCRPSPVDGWESRTVDSAAAVAFPPGAKPIRWSADGRLLYVQCGTIHDAGARLEVWRWTSILHRP